MFKILATTAVLLGCIFNVDALATKTQLQKNPKFLSQTKAEAFFVDLRQQFAQQAMTEEEAYLAIAKKLLLISDKLDTLELCMHDVQ